jgi:SAM-dependent methyltransferase
MSHPDWLVPEVTDFLEKVLSRLSDTDLRAFLLEAIARRVSSVPPADALRFLLRLDAELYPLQGQLSVAYGGGLHTKHRHTRYHDFFVQRIRKGERILDVGCGIGALAFDLANRAGACVVGIDVNPEQIAIAKSRHAHPNVVYVVGDALTEPLDGPFDAVVLSNVLEHLENRPSFLRRLVEAAGRAKLLIRVPVFERDWRVPLKQELGIDYRLDPTHYTEYTLETFASEMTEAGLSVCHQQVRWGEIWAETVGGNACL